MGRASRGPRVVLRLICPWRPKEHQAATSQVGSERVCFSGSGRTGACGEVTGRAGVQAGLPRPA